MATFGWVVLWVFAVFGAVVMAGCVYSLVRPDAEVVEPPAPQVQVVPAAEPPPVVEAQKEIGPGDDQQVAQKTTLTIVNLRYVDTPTDTKAITNG